MRAGRKAVKYPPAFDRVWSVYPNKAKKVLGLMAFMRAGSPEAEILAALTWQVASPAWTRDGGDYVPHFATYCNQRRWEDEPSPPPPPPGPTRTRAEAAGLAAVERFARAGRADAPK